jgi:hypothetical protein
MKCEIQEFILQDIFLLIGLKARTGELMLESGNNIGSVVFRDGRILQAFSPYSRAIGDLLVEQGIVTEEELLATLKLQKQQPDTPVGGLLVKSGRVSLEAIEMMVHEQIRQSVKEFITWDKLRISFLEKDIHPFDRIQLPVHEFLPPDLMNASKAFIAEAFLVQEQTPSPTSTTAYRLPAA